MQLHSEVLGFKASTCEFCGGWGSKIQPVMEGLAQGSDMSPVMLYIFSLIAIWRELRAEGKPGC